MCAPAVSPALPVVEAPAAIDSSHQHTDGYCHGIRVGRYVPQRWPQRPSQAGAALLTNTPATWS
jgi:hypothetical protein